jgi:cytochrome b
MNKHLIYDLPTRLFHWLFAGLFVTAFIIAKTMDDESPLFSYHMLAGMLLGFVVVLRLIWGFVGTKYARFASFALYPRDLVAYFSAMLSGDKRKWVGHNPASSWATLLMFGLALALGITGYLMVNGQKETFEDIHELLANGFLIVVLLHVAGIILHTMRHQDSILLTMIGGAKYGIAVPEPVKPRPVAGFVFLALVACFGLYLKSGFDSERATLAFLGTTLSLGEIEGGEDGEHERGEKGERHDRDHDEDDDD